MKKYDIRKQPGLSALLFALITVLIFSSCRVKEKALNAEEQEQLLRKELGISSQTKWSHEMINQIQYYDEEGRLIDEKWYNPNGVVVTRRVLGYNENSGLLDSTIWYKGEDILRSRYRYSYYADGNLAQEIWLTPLDEVQTKSVYRYEDGKLVEMIKFDKADNLISTSLYTYDRDNLVLFLERDRRDILINRLIYEYDRNDNLLEERWQNDEGEVRTRRVYTYENGVRNSKTEYRFGEFVHRAVYEYDENGLISREVWFNEQDEQIFENLYTYEYGES